MCSKPIYIDGMEADFDKVREVVLSEDNEPDQAICQWCYAAFTPADVFDDLCPDCDLLVKLMNAEDLTRRRP